MATGDVLLKVAQKVGGAAGGVQRAELGGPPQGPVAQGRWGLTRHGAQALQRGGRLRRGAGDAGAAGRRRAAGAATPRPPSMARPGRTASASRRSPRCWAMAASPTGPGCWSSPTRSPRSPGTPGSRFTRRPPGAWTSGRARSSGSPRRTAPSRRRSTSIRASTRTWWRSRSAWGTPRYGEFATGRGVNALDLLDAKDGKGFLPYLSHPGHADQDPQLQAGGQDRRHHPPAGPGHRRRDDPGAGQAGA